MKFSVPASSPTALIAFMFLLISGTAASGCKCDGNRLPQSDVDLLEFPLNLEYLEAEYFSWGALGKGLDFFEPELARGGPSSIGVQKAKLSPFVRDIIKQFAFQEFGHLRAIQETVKGFPRPLLNLSAKAFATVVDKAFEKPLEPPFDPYANDINFLIASYIIPYVGLTSYVGAIPNLECFMSKKLQSGLLGVEAGQDAVTRAYHYKHALMKVSPYNITVAEFTNKISRLRNKLGRMGLKDEGLIVKPELGAEGRVSGNVLAGNRDSLSYPRTPEEILRIVYGNGKENKPGLFYPEGAKGRIARSYLNEG